MLGAESLGKAKMTFEVIALVPLIARYRLGPIDLFQAGMVFLWIALLVALWSGIAYPVRLVRALQQRA